MSTIEITPGIKGKQEEKVAYENTAVAYGSGLVEVYATPAMIAFMEKTCLESVSAFLPDAYSSVGMKVSVKHVKATPKGQSVRCESELIAVDRRKLSFSVKAWDEDGLIGEGTHDRFIIDMKKFMQKMK